MFFGVQYPQTQKAMLRDKEPFLFVDHAYFNRGYQLGNFRVCQNAFHKVEWEPRPADRRRIAPKLDPWKKDGGHIVVVPPADSWKKIIDFGDWTQRVCSTLKRHTQRKVIVLEKKGGFLDAMKRSWAVVVNCSVAGVEAAIAGYPVFCEPLCPAYPVACNDYSKIETPLYPDREEWLNSLCYAQWNVKEFGEVRRAYLGSHYVQS